MTAGQALAAAQARGGGDPFERAITAALIHRLIGDIHAQGGNRGPALAAWRTALAQWPSGSETPRQMAVRAELLANVGRTAEAAALSRTVQQTGLRQLI